MSTDLIARLRSVSADLTPALERVPTAVLTAPDMTAESLSDRNY